MTYLKTHIQSLIILILLGIIILQRCTAPKPCAEPVSKLVVKTSVIHDTVTERYDSIVYSKPVVKNIYVPKITSITTYIKDTTGHISPEAYSALATNYYSKVLYADTLRIDTLGYVSVADSVTKNSISGRTYNYHLHAATVVNNITTEKTTIIPQKFQIYAGGAIMGNNKSLVNGFSIGLIIKTKKDKTYEFKVIQPFSGVTSYSLGTYWKIHF